MQVDDDIDLATQYYRLRGQHIYYQHTLDNYRRYGALAPILEQFSPLCSGFVHDLGNGLNAILSKLESLTAEQACPAGTQPWATCGCSLPAFHEHRQAIDQAKAFCTSCGWRLYALPEISPSPPIHPEPVNLPEWIPNILGTLSVWKPPSVHVQFQAAEPRLIVADYDNMLRLALLEPILNAFQALRKGGQISVSVHKSDDGLAQIEIADTGPGLAVADPETCFDLRFTAGPYRYGLGLYVARKVVEKHRGTFALETHSVLSQRKPGTRAVIRLPLGNPEPDWDDESALAWELERLHDVVASQERAIAACRQSWALPPHSHTPTLPHSHTLSQLADLFGQLCASTVQLLQTGLDGIRRLLSERVRPFLLPTSYSLLLEKCDYLEAVLGNARALDPGTPLRLAPTDLNQVVSQIVRLIAWRTQPGTQLHVSPTVPLPPVQADASLIATALLNVLRNALDAAGSEQTSSRQAYGRVDVQTSCTGQAVLVQVTNTGIQIPSTGPTVVSTDQDAQSRIFDLDYTTRHGRSFGLGLYVARAIVAMHDGTIRACNLPPSRVRFEIALPRMEHG